MSMQWSSLLSTTRLGQSRQYPKEGRTDYNTDHDRIIFSSSFRRLQDKTQVFPLAETDYVRTRLTHSLEASNIGRTLGILVGRAVIAKHGLADCAEDDFGAIVATAALAHDIGNPPFGHSGEFAIRDWFENNPVGQAIISELGSAEQYDFLKFEGNAQGFRILTRLQYPDRSYGMRLTCAVLGAFMKYPCDAETAFSGNGTYGKFGLHVDERAMFAAAAETLGMPATGNGAYEWARHPLTYLVEAADDISYTIADIEDGFKRGLVSLEQVCTLLEPLIDTDGDWWKDAMDGMQQDTEKVEFLRALAIGGAVKSAVACFMDAEEELLAGKYLKGGLTRHMALAKPFNDISTVNFSKVYQGQQVVEIEAAGFEVMDKLLTVFGGALFREYKGAATARDTTALKLFPRRKQEALSLYQAMLQVTDMVSGLTDTSAVALYKKLSGMTLSKGAV